MMIAADGIDERRIADALAAQLRNLLHRKASHQPVVYRIRGRAEAHNRLAALDQKIRRNMIARDKIDIAAKQRFLRRLRAAAKLKAHFESDLVPDSRLLHHFPDR